MKLSGNNGVIFMTVCKKCLYTSETPGIKFNKDGICNYCELHDELNRQFPIDRNKLLKVAKNIRNGEEYDCVVGMSGGCDSSYMLYIVKEVMKLNPLAVHFDNGWNTKIAKSNMIKMTKGLNVDLVTYKVDPAEYNDIYKSFMKAGLPDIEACTDIALQATLYKYADIYNIKYIMVGHSFRTEGISPLGWSYMDGGYIKNIQDTFGKYKLLTYPNLTFWNFIKYMMKGIKRIRPLYYVDYKKEEVKKFLSDKYDWVWYDGHHKESVITDFVKNYWTFKRYGVDKRMTELSGTVRSGHISKSEAEKIIKEPPSVTNAVIGEVKDKLDLSDSDIHKYLVLAGKKTYRDFKTYKKRFEKLRAFFWIMMKLNRVPKSFYTKYCKR